MIGAKIPAANGLARRLAAKAGAMAGATVESRLRGRQADPRRWRQARLLWPLFARDLNGD
jgi:hypothetical protein